MKKLITLSLTTASLLIAASPNIGDVVKEIKPPKDSTAKSESLVEINEAKKYSPAMEDKSGKTVFVKSFKITGAMHMDEKELQALISSYTNKELTFAQLQEVASIITKAYREKGYFVARAYLPVQTMQDGIIEIAVVEGNYGKFKLNNSSLVKDSIVQGMLDDIKDKNIVSTTTLERAMLIINDTAGAKVTQADVMPGELVGTSDFAIKTEATPRYDGYIIGDNYGSRYTGKNRLTVGANLNSPLGIGDKLGFIGMLSQGTELKYGRVSYGAPLMSNGLSGELSYSNTRYTLGNEYDYLDAYGSAQSTEGTLNYPIIRTRHETLRLNSGIAFKRLNDYQNGGIVADKKIVAFTAGLSHAKDHKLFGMDLQTNSALTYTSGNLKLNDSASQATDAAGANTQGRYSKLGGSIGGMLTINKETWLNANLSFQKALGHKNLDGTEDFSVTGEGGVKVYPTSELSAENGAVFNIEFLKALPAIGGYTHKVGLFYDAGRAYMEDSSNIGASDSRTLQDIGVGYYAAYKSFFTRAQLAHIIGGGAVTSEPDYRNRFLIQAGWSF
jgi:hemolysin activation/secretion protein